jgi:hypothetical protein
MLRIQTVFHRLQPAVLLTLLGHTLSAAELPALLAAALDQLQTAANHTWAVTTDTPGAPFKVGPYRGRTDSSGWVLLETEVGKTSWQVAGLGDRRLLKTPAGWITVTEKGAPKGSDLLAVNDLLAAPLPAAELASLLPALTGLRGEADGSFVGVIPEDIAIAYINSLVKGRGPGGFTPDLKINTGRLQLWLKDARPARYTTTIHATASLPFGKKDLNRITTVELAGFGTSPVTVPAEAKAKLGL